MDFVVVDPQPAAPNPLLQRSSTSRVRSGRPPLLRLLRILDVSGCGGMTDEGLQRAPLACSGLHTLRANDCPLVRR